MARTRDDDAKKTLGRNLVAARDRAGLKQGPAAEQAGLTQQNRLSLWETGKEFPSTDGLLRLAVAYRCPIDDFLGGVDESYDAIIERRIPIDAKQHYEVQIDRLVKAYGAAIRLLASSGIELSQLPGARADESETAPGKSKAARARRTRKKK